MQRTIALGLAALFLGTTCLQVIAGAPAAFDATPWLEDLEQMRHALATGYANLEWLVFDREVDVSGLFEDASGGIKSASDEAQAKAAFDRVVRGIGDGHVRVRWPRSVALKETPLADCAALEYDGRMNGKAVSPLIPGYMPLAENTVSEFPAGMIEVGRREIGVIRIGIFSPKGFPAQCEAALRALRIPSNAQCDEHWWRASMRGCPTEWQRS